MSRTAGTISGGTPRNTSRQLRWSATHPASSGPTIEGSTQALDSAAKIRGRSVSG